MPDPLISDEANLLPTQVMDIPVKVDKTPPVSKLSKWENATATLIDFVDEESGENLKIRTIIPTSKTFSLVATGTDNSSILSYYLFGANKAAGIDPANTSTFTYNILEVVLDGTGTTNWEDGTIFVDDLVAEDGAGNVGVGERVFLVYDNPNTKVGLGNLEAVADGEYLKVSFKVLNAPGATYKVTIKDTNGSVVQEFSGVVSALGPVSEEVVKYKVPAAGKYTIEVTAKDIYENTAKVTTAISLDLLKITIIPESTFMVVKQGTSTGISVVVEGPAKTGTVSLSRIAVENGEVKTTIVKSEVFSGNSFDDPTFIDDSLDAGRYQINVEVKSAFGFVSASSRRVVIDGQAPKIDDVNVISDSGAITVEKQINGNAVDILAKVEQDTTGQLVLKVSDDFTYFDVYLGNDHIGGWGDSGSSGEGTFFVPVALEIGTSQTFELKLLDEAGNSSEYSVNIRVVTSLDNPPTIEDVSLNIAGDTIGISDRGTYTVTTILPAEGVLSFTATDDLGLVSVAVKLNGEIIAHDSPATITFDNAGSFTIEIVATDNSEQTTTFRFTLILVKEPVIYNLRLEAGLSYFGFPIQVDKPISAIIPNANVYRSSGTGWVLANNEKPMPFAVYMVNLSAPRDIVLAGDLFQPSTLTLRPSSTNYVSIPQVDPISVYDLVGDSLESVKVRGLNGVLSPVSDGMLQPGKAYIIIVNREVKITLP